MICKCVKKKLRKKEKYKTFQKEKEKNHTQSYH